MEFCGLLKYYYIKQLFRGIGLASIFAGYGITFYYCIILAWAFVYFGASFQATANIPWMSNTEDYFNEISMGKLLFLITDSPICDD